MSRERKRMHSDHVASLAVVVMNYEASRVERTTIYQSDVVSTLISVIRRVAS